MNQLVRFCRTPTSEVTSRALSLLVGVMRRVMLTSSSSRDEHCNNLHTRWILRNHGIVLGGPSPQELVDPVSEQAMREAARQALPGTLEGIREWADMDHAWTQRYIVQSYSRVLYTAETGKVASKPTARAAGSTPPGCRC